MSFTDKKITNYEGKDLISSPDIWIGSASENKARMEQMQKEIIVKKHNDLIDNMVAPEAMNSLGASFPDVIEKNLGAILNYIKLTFDDIYRKTETDSAITGNINELVESVMLNTETGVLTVVKKDGSRETTDTNLEKIPAKMELVEIDGVTYLQITNDDGSTSRTNVSDLIDEYDFINSNEIQFYTNTIDGKHFVNAEIRDYSISENKLDHRIMGEIENNTRLAQEAAGQAANSASSASASSSASVLASESAANSASSALASANSAETYMGFADSSSEKANISKLLAQDNAELAQSYAVGGTGARPGESVDNAKYYSEQAKAAAGGNFLTVDGDGSMVTVKDIAIKSGEIEDGLDLKSLFGIVKKKLNETAGEDVTGKELNSGVVGGQYAEVFNGPFETTNNTASGIASHAEGRDTYASGDYSHAQGYKTTASGLYAHAEGYNLNASGIASHAEGYQAQASGDYSHAQGRNSQAIGALSHASGYNTFAKGFASFSGGTDTEALGENQMVIGKENLPNATDAFIIGNGTDSSNRSNAFTVGFDGIVRAYHDTIAVLDDYMVLNKGINDTLYAPSGFGWGDNLIQYPNDSKNFNDYPKSSVTFQYISTEAKATELNAPPITQPQIFITETHRLAQDNHGYQVARLCYSHTRSSYTRYCQNNIWGPWQRIPTTDEVAPSGFGWGERKLFTDIDKIVGTSIGDYTNNSIGTKPKGIVYGRLINFQYINSPDGAAYNFQVAFPSVSGVTSGLFTRGQDGNGVWLPWKQMGTMSLSGTTLNIEL